MAGLSAPTQLNMPTLVLRWSSEGEGQPTNANIGFLVTVIDWDLGDALNPLLDSIGDMGHHLDSPA